MGIEDFCLDILEIRLVQAKLALQGAIGDASAALEHIEHAIQHLLKGHCQPSVWLRHCSRSPATPRLCGASAV
jgi:hypothetical protein